MKFSAENYQIFKREYKRGGICFVPYYSYKGVRVSGNEVQHMAEIENKTISELDLTSKQRAGIAPIMQTDVNRAVSKLSASFKTTAYITDPELLPMLMDGNSLAERLFETQGVYTMKQLQAPENAALLAMVQQYLAPHLKRFQEASGKQAHNFSLNEGLKADNNRSGNRQGSEEVTTVSGGASAVASLGDAATIGGSAAGSKTWRKYNENYSEQERLEQALQSLQNATGTTFTVAEDWSEFRPHSIKIYRMKEGATSLKLRDIRQVYRRIGEEDRYLEDSPINGLWTEELLDNFIFGL